MRGQHFLNSLRVWWGATILLITHVAYAGNPVLILPTSEVEGAGVLTNIGQFNLGGPASSNMVVTLQSSDSTSLSVPSSVTISSGQSNVFFNVTIGDNLIVDGNRYVTVTATTAFSTNTTTVLIIDNDPDHIQFSAVTPVVDTNTGFVVLITAMNADGSVQTNFSKTLTLTATGLEGSLPLASSNTGSFSGGQLSANIQVTAPGHGIRIGCLEYPGQSDAFTVIPNAFFLSPQPVADIVWLQASQTLMATVPSAGGVNSNCLVSIDPTSGLATNSYPIGFNPGQVEVSPDGTFLYMALSNQTMLQRFNISTGTVGSPIVLGTNSSGVRIAYDFSIPPAMTDSVVVAARIQGSLGTSIDGIYRSDSGTLTYLTNLSASGGYLVESLDTAYGVALSPPLATANAATGTVINTAPAFGGKAVIYRGGQFFDDHGDVYSSGNLLLNGTYPGVLDQINYSALPEVDTVSRRAFFLSGYFNFGNAFYKLKVYDRDLFQLLYQYPMPGGPATPTRVRACGTNFLAYVTGNNQLWIIRPDATQPPRPPADLSLSASAPESIPIAGSNYTFSLVLSNAGPGVASVVEVTNALPVNTAVIQTVASSGTVRVYTNSSLVWNVSNLGPGSNATLQLTVQFNNGGWQTNTAWALGFEDDPVYTNNIANLPLNVELPPQGYGVFAFNNCATQDLLYDPVRDRLLLSVGTGVVPGQSNGLVVFNPYNGLAESFTPTGFAPGRMAASGDGQFLYLSLPDAGTVQQLNLPTLTTNYGFAVGGEVIYGAPYTNYAKNLAVVPGQPNSVVAWALRHVNGGSGEFGYGITLYQNGIMASNVTATGGNWETLFDTNSGTLLAYNGGQLCVCALDSNGVSFAQQFPTISSGGSDIEYGAGHLFASGGEMVDYNPFNVDWLFAGTQGGTAVVPDPPNGRVFYLVNNGGWQMRAYDISTSRFLGSIAISNLFGAPSRLIRWGLNGLAFQTSSNQLFIIRSPLVPTNASADLALTVTAPASPVSPGSNATFTVTVTNAGSAQASNVIVTTTFSGGNVISALPGAGTAVTNGLTVTWKVPALAAVAQATLTCTIVTGLTGPVSAVSTVIASTFDPYLPNNTATANATVAAPLALDGTLAFPPQLILNDVVWSPSLGKFLATANTNTCTWGGCLLTVDPGTLAVQLQTALGGDSGRLAISHDDAVLYAGTDFGVAAVNLSLLTVSNRFLINPTSPGDYPVDMEVSPASNQLLVVGSRAPGNNSMWVAMYNSGVQLSNEDNFYSTLLSLAFGSQPSPLYAYNGSAFNRYTIDTNGVTLLDSTSGLLPGAAALNLVSGNGLIYSSSGRVINPSSLSLVGTIAGIASGSLVVYDTNSAWLFCLSPGTNQAVLSAFDGATLLPAGSRLIPGINGSLARFIRWGVDGFAAITSTGQFVIFRNSIIPTNPPADVSVSFAQVTPPYIQGSNITATITVSNSGPNPATAVSWSNALPAGSLVQSASTSMGSIVTNAGSVGGNISVLSPGTTANITVVFTVPAAGVVTNQVFATASSVDPNFANNSAVSLLWIQPTNGASNVLTLTLPVKDLASDPTRAILYASLDSSAGPLANTVVTIDPVRQSIGTPVSVGSNPGKLAVSSDGTVLYVALDGAGMVQKLSLPDLTPVSSFTVAPSQTVVRMQVCPTNSDLVAIRRSPAGETGFYVGGQELPNELSSQDLFAFLDTTGQLFGCDGFHSNVKLYQLDTSSNGLALLAGQPGKQSLATDLQSSGGLLFYSGGMVMNPVTLTGLDLLPVPSGSVLAADANCGRSFYLYSTNSVWAIHAFDIAQGIEVGAVPLPSQLSAPQKLVRWGTSGFATFNTNSQIVILNGQLVPTNPPVDVVLTQTLSGTSATTNDLLTVSLAVTNLGPVSASGTVVSQNFSLPLTNVTITAFPGTAVYSNGSASWQIGSLDTNTVATLSVTGRASRAGTMTVASFAHHNLNDVFWGNNAAIGVVNVLGTATSNTLVIGLSAHNLAYDPTRNVIYASTPGSNGLAGNLIVQIDPATGTVKNPEAAGSEPDQISLSADGSYLHVALDGAMGAERLNLVSNIFDLSYSFSTNDILFAQNLVVDPVYPQTLAASFGSYNLAAGYPSTVAIFDNGVARTNLGGPAQGLTYSSDGSTLFGYIPFGQGAGLERMVLGPQGLSTFPVSGFGNISSGLTYCNGRVYAQSGQVLDLNAGVLLGSFGSLSGPEAIDGAAGRAFSVGQSGTNWLIHAYDLATLQSAGTQTIGGAQGSPSSLIRCGQDRLAFLTSAGQVYITHCPLVVTNPVTPANIAVSQTATQDFTAPVETLRFSISVTNRGPASASNVLLAISPPSPVASISLQLSQGSSTNSGGNYLCNLGNLPAGQGINVLLSAVITNTTLYTNLASLSAATPDPDLSDNTSVVSLQGLYFLRPDTNKAYPSTGRALAYEPQRQWLFASQTPVGTNNLIAWFDPQSGLQLGSMPAAIAADRMLITDDSQYLYLASASNNLVQRINIASLTPDLSFVLSNGVGTFAMAAIPGSPQSVAVTTWLSTGANPNTSIYDDGVPRTNAVTDQKFTSLAFPPVPTNLFGYAYSGTGIPHVFRMSVTNSGLAELDSGPRDTPSSTEVQMNYFSNQLFFAWGDVLNPTGWVSGTSFSLSGTAANGFNLLPGNSDRAAFLTSEFSASQVGHLAVFSISTRQKLEQFDLTTSIGGYSNPTWCGADRFAMLVTGGIIFVRSGSIPTADISVHASFSTNQIMAGDPVTLQIVVSNSGPSAVTNLSLTNVLPYGFGLLSNTVSQGALTSTNGTNLVFTLGAMGTNSQATLSLVIGLSNSSVNLVTNAVIVTNTVIVGASDLSDPIPFNNTAAQQLTMQPRDSNHDGIPDYWDAEYGFDPNDPNVASEDAAGDGISNLQKYLAGINPFAFVGMRITGWSLTATSNFDLAVHAAVGTTYALQYSPNLAQWITISNFLCVATNQIVIAPFDPAAPETFYRIASTTNTPIPLLKILNPTAIDSSAPILQIAAPPGYSYTLYASSNLVDWTALTNFYATIWNTTVTDTVAQADLMRFYRARVQ